VDAYQRAVSGRRRVDGDSRRVAWWTRSLLHLLTFFDMSPLATIAPRENVKDSTTGRKCISSVASSS
jgi:hypothetical protein